ncbi:MAG: hypothetical protein H0T82_07390 [Sphingomonas sp.]|nr:hypothetical protein [Sphingomonas sp.]
MRDATRTLLVAGAAAGLAACGGGEGSQDQNIAIDNIGEAEIEALPADESSATPTNVLVNGTTDDPDVPTADSQTDGY